MTYQPTDLQKAPAILAKVQKAVANWTRYAKEADVSAKSTKMVADRIKV